ncbi:MAG: glutathione S-transferase family protein [Cyanobacteria bacterium P01_A01_bin.123]
MPLQLYELAAAERDRRFSPYCWRIRLALAHKQLDFDPVPIRFTDKDQIAFSGQGRVPVLVDGDEKVVDSWAIAEYLERTYPDQPTLFSDAQAKAYAFFIKSWDESILVPALFPLIIWDIFNRIAPEDQAYFRETREKMLGKPLESFANPSDEKVEAFRAILKPLRQTLAHQPFLAGDAPAFADHIVMGRLQIARCMSSLPLLANNDPILAWRDRLLTQYESCTQTLAA